ncbi:hypothetical protein SD941_08430 [Lactobacillus paragasseri]|uniref:hypothetical protein n=1 Tax=Lactobacillus paragasseri TaxID=2107999 RepID=UPI0012E21929|nr:hypothetical protein [Lactobacillus paragasseri]MDK8087200.1 hypothetical protein [Lactobacillus paragasseri]MDX5119101.1 hypothetical protein [Lactobacillus paragasseri]MDX5123000.1 hypothetical protein [Lactobacillus paragasseri]QGT98470.1 hypothetical protein F2Y32_08950 [Lactobacillus paragasseri]UWI46172.1 hypothetical protein HR118_00085 [Lactobacillus paragasseri]
MEYQEYISLLEAFRLSLTAENDPEVNKIVDQINETVANLKTGKYHAMALTQEVFEVIDLVNKDMAFNGLKFNSYQSKVWNRLKEQAYRSYTKDRNALGFSGAFGVSS